MNRRTTIAVLLLLVATTATAQSPARDEAINQIEEAMGRPAVTPDSPLVTSTLTAAKKANPDADLATWEAVRAETAVALNKLASGPGSTFDVRIRGALGSFTDDELRSLNKKLSDPLLLKFRDALNGQPRTNNILSGVMQMTTEVNVILDRHRLKEVSFQ